MSTASAYGSATLSGKKDILLDALAKELASDRMPDSRYSDLVEQIEAAPTDQALEPIAASILLRAPAPAPQHSAYGIQPAAPQAGTRYPIVSVMSSRTVDLPNLQHPHVTPVAVLGEVTIDLRDRELPAESTIQAVAVMGQIRILLPPGVIVENNVSPVMGEVKIKYKEASRNGKGPILRIGGVAVMGEVRIQ